jgi:hypothetical protein
VIRELTKKDTITTGSKPEDGYEFEFVGNHGLLVTRPRLPNALVYCANVWKRGPFDLEDLDKALDELPDAQFVAVFPKKITHPVYERADILGLCVDGVDELVSALRYYDDISDYEHKEQAYLLGRLEASKVVRSVRRRGFRAYEIERAGLPALTTITIDRYELTADDVYRLLKDYSGLDVDAVTITNPNAGGISTDARRAGAQAGVRVLLLRDLLHSLDSP